MKTVLFVPGSGEDINSRDYRSTIQAIRQRGYTVKFVPITWPRTTIESWVKELETEYIKHDPRHTILAGFSFGAMTAFVAAARRNPSELWLFSLSSYFAEDMVSKNQKKTWVSELGHRRADAFRALDFKKLASKVTCRSLIFYGQNELDKWPIMDERAQGARRYLKNNQYIAIPEVGHDVTDKKYIEAIKRLI
jgi:pimeloyl-ACP methyl ester carboxylesterase